MRLTALQVRRLPGIDQPFELKPGPGVNLLIGPNAAGKSSVARAVRDLLWPELRETEIAWLRATFRADDAEWTVTCDGPTTAWLREGRPTPAPLLPPAHLADCYRLSAPDLLGSHGGFDRDLAAAIRTDMTGGYDLDGLAGTLPRPTRQKARPLTHALRNARQDVARIDRAQQELAGRREGESDLEARAAAAEAAGRRFTALEAHRAATAALRSREEAAAALEIFPAAMAAVRPDDADHLARLREVQADRALRQGENATEIAELEREIATLGLPAETDAEAGVERIVSLAEACRRSSHACDVAAERHGTFLLVRARAAARTADPDQDGGDNDTLVDLHRTLAAADAGLGAFAAELATPAEAPGPTRRMVALALLVGGGLAMMAGALPVLSSTTLRLVLSTGGGAVACVGAFVLASWSRARMLHERRADLEQAAATAVRSRDELAAQGTDLARAAAEADEARRRLAADLAALGPELDPWGLPAPGTAAAAEAARDDLRGRLRRHDDLTARLGRARRDRDRATQEAETAGAQAAELLRRLGMPDGPGDETSVRELVKQHPAWLAASGNLRDADAALRRLREEAERHATATDLSIPDGADLEILMATAATEAAEAPRLREELGSLRQELRTADAGHELGVALAREQECRDEIGAWVDRARDELAEIALLDELQQQHEKLATPPRMRAANRLLDEFTHGRHAIVLAAGAGTGFLAEDHRTGEVLRLDQLSDGTRAQVLLAVRVAFVAGTETGAAPPLFLDESLTTSDPERLSAVAASLGRLAESTGRQVFYLTSQPGDVAAWRGALADADLSEPAVLDLAAVRREGVAATPDQLAPSAAVVVPAPAGSDPAAYGRLLRVAAVDPHRPWQEIDTFYLAAPDLELVRRLRTAGLSAAGPLEQALPRLAHAGVADARQRTRLTRALEILRAFVSAWRIGRPRPVTIADIDAGSAVTGTFRPRVLQLLAEHGWHGRRFLAAAADGGLPRFQTRKLELLRDELTEAGCLDEQTPLTEDALVAEVALQVAASSHEEARTSPTEVRALVLQLLAAIPAAVAIDPATRPSGSDPTD